MNASPADTQTGAAALAQRLLDERARRYARQELEGESGEVQDLLFFQQGDSRYALALGALREVRVLRGFCPIPGARAAVPGIFYSRGEVLSLHDLSAYMTGRRVPDVRWVIIVEWKRQRLGILAQDVVDVRSTPMSALRPPPITLGERGVTVQGAVGEALLLRVEALFSTPAFFHGLRG